jgi:hypothetical protein
MTQPDAINLLVIRLIVLKNTRLAIEINNRSVKKMYTCNVLLTSIKFLVFAKFLILNLNVIALQNLANVNLTNLSNTNFFFIIVIFLNVTFFANLVFVNVNLFFVIVFNQLLVRFLETISTKSIIDNK